MDYTLFEINKHKNTISTLSTQLNNTFDISQEIIINNEIKKETEILNSLLTIKQNTLANPINQNNNNNFAFQMFNQNIMNNNFNQNHPQMMQNIELENNQNHFYLMFVKDSKAVPIACRLEEKFSDVIARYKNKTNSQTTMKYSFLIQELFLLM